MIIGRFVHGSNTTRNLRVISIFIMGEFGHLDTFGVQLCSSIVKDNISMNYGTSDVEIKLSYVF